MTEHLYPTILYSAFFLCILFLLYKKRTGYIPMYIAGIWTFSSIYAVIFQILFDGYYKNISIIPYLYIILCFVITLRPIIRYCDNFENKIPYVYDRVYKYLMWFFIIISIVPFVENAKYVITSYRAVDTSALADMYNEKMYGAGVRATWLSTIGMFGNSIDGIFIQFLLFTPFYFLIRKDVDKKLQLLSFIPLLNHVLFQLATSGRGFVTQVMLMAFFFMLLFRKNISHEKKRLVRVLFLVFTAIFTVTMTILTIVRRDTTNAGTETEIVVGYYVAKSHVDFNEEMWHIKKNTEGDNSFGFVKKMIGLDVPANKNEYWNESKIGIVPSLFYTYIGDWFMDFGAIITLLLFIVFAEFFARIFSVSNTKESIIPLFFFFIYCEILINGWSINIFKTEGGLRNLLFSIGLIFCVDFISNKHIPEK